MQPLKVLTVVGTRPEIIRLSRVIAALDKSPVIDHKLVHTGQNFDFELNEIFFEDLEIRVPDYFLRVSGFKTAETIGRVIIEIDPILEKENPDAFLILGDTNSCLSAIAAKKRKIPIFHMEAGNRCFDQRVPEETNRKLVDHLSDINLPYSTIAREYLLREGLTADQIIKTGSPMFEVLQFYKLKIDQSRILETLGLMAGQYFVVSTHRDENVTSTKNFETWVNMLNAISARYQLPVIVSAHPRTLKKIEDASIQFHDHVRLLKPLNFSDYNKLQLHAKCVLSDSGTISEEASILGFPALNIRESHERPEAMEEAAVIMTGMKLDIILHSIEYLVWLGGQISPISEPVSDYQDPWVSHKVVKIILSYTDYVNRRVWRKEA